MNRLKLDLKRSQQLVPRIVKASWSKVMLSQASWNILLQRLGSISISFPDVKSESDQDTKHDPSGKVADEPVVTHSYLLKIARSLSRSMLI